MPEKPQSHFARTGSLILLAPRHEITFGKQTWCNLALYQALNNTVFMDLVSPSNCTVHCTVHRSGAITWAGPGTIGPRSFAQRYGRGLLLGVL